MSFLFVEKITDLNPGQWARGRFTVPQGLPELSHWLVAEAIGQLAGWVAMAKSEFRSRPVAALVSEVKVEESPRAGATLDLGVEIERCDDRAVLYSGWARVDGEGIAEINRCVGPLLPMEQFDEPAAVRRRFELLCSTGMPAQVDPAVYSYSQQLVTIERVAGESRQARFQVPESASLFADHFPRKPVFPATLLIDAQCCLAAELAAEVLGTGAVSLLRIARVRDVKVRAFSPPGQLLENGAHRSWVGEGATEVLVSTAAEGKRVATARVEIRKKTP